MPVRNFFIFFLVLWIFCPVFAEAPAQNPITWLAELESTVSDSVQIGALIERLSKLEETVLGRTYDGSIVERLSRLDRMLFVNQPHDVSLLFKIQTLEWVLYQRGFSGPISERLERIEILLFQTIYDGPITKRLEKLVNQVFPEGTLHGKWVNIPEGLVVKVKMVNELSSAISRPGTRFQFEVNSTVYSGNFVLFPEGIIGNGILARVNRPENLGRDAKLMLDFAEIKTLDGTPVKLVYGAKALEMDRSRQFAMGASAAGMLAFGPGGILFGLAIKGKETTIPSGTEFYLQVKDPVRIYTIQK